MYPILLFISNIAGTYALRSQPLLQYDMTMNDCQRSIFFNRGTLGKEYMKLIRNSSTTTCIIGAGIESGFMEDADNENKSKALYSATPIGPLLDELIHDASPVSNKSGLTFSLWIRPSSVQEYACKRTENCNKSSNIFTIGWNSVSSSTFPPTGLALCETSNIDFQLSTINDDCFEIIYRTSNQAFEPCQRLKFNVSSIVGADDGAKSYSRPLHLAITLGNYNQKVFLNGKILGRKREPFDVDLKHWNPMSYLEFFTYPTNGNHKLYPWEGQLFQLSVYRDAFNKNQVKSILSEGLSLSQPVAYPISVHIDEDAVDESGTLEQIQMPYSFLDDEIDGLLTSLDIPHQPAAHVRHYITRFPTRGYLFHIDDRRKIEPSQNLPVYVNNMDRLIYIPKKDEHSDFVGYAYTSFDYCVTTNKIIMSSQCTPATISVVVDPINDPPVAILPPIYYVYEGIQSNAPALLLTGSDVDKKDFIQAVQITSLPRMGNLFLSVSSFRKDNLLHGTILSSQNTTIAGKELYVEYQFTNYETTTVQDLLVMDFFRFRVQDSVGSWSSEVEAKVHVLSSVFSFSEIHYNWTVPMIQAEGINNQLSGIDKSGLNRTLGFLMLSLPSKGIIVDGQGTPVLTNNIIEPSEAVSLGDYNLAKLNLTYIGSRSTCSESDHLLVSDVLQYQVVALSSTMEVMSVSSALEEKINIVCRVEPVHMHAVNEQSPMKTFTFVSSADNLCSGYMFDFTEESKIKCHNTTAIFGIRTSNTKKLPEPVYVMMKTYSGGLLSLNQNWSSNNITFFDQPIMRSKIRFLVNPERLNAILSAIHFQSHSSGKDEIEILLQYGRCSHNFSFLLDNEYSKSTLECYKTQKKIEVNVLQNPLTFGSPYCPFPWISLLIIAVSGPIFYIKGKAKQAIEIIYEDWKDESALDNANEISLEMT